MQGQFLTSQFHLPLYHRSIYSANPSLHTITLDEVNNNWEEALKAGKGRLRPLDPSVDLDLIFSLHYERSVKKDDTFSFKGREFKLSYCGGERVTVCLIPKKKLMVLKNEEKVGEFHL